MNKVRENIATTGDLLVQAKITNRLLSAQLKTIMSQQDLIALLGTTEATPKEIADILNTTPGTVSTALDRMKKRSIQK
jgi:DNA-binding MarR family transcriptional regulator